MPAIKRNASPELLGHPSPYHASVTLFEPDAESTLRRSKRVKVKQEEDLPTVKELKVTKTRAATSSTPAKASTSAIKVEDIELKLVKSTSSSRTGTPVSPAKKAKPVQQALAVPHPAPPRWKEAYDAIKTMREHIVAPVDTMGCDQAQYKETDPKVCSIY